jgi:hypothetical protein
MSATVRTPLTVIKEFCSIIADGLAGPTTPEQGQYLGIIDGAVLDLNLVETSQFEQAALDSCGWIGVHRGRKHLRAGRPGLQAATLVYRRKHRSNLPPVFADEKVRDHELATTR